MTSALSLGTMGRPHPWIVLALLAARPAWVAGQASKPLAQEAPEAEAGAKAPAMAQGEVVTELDPAIWHVFQARNGDYWFGSHDRGAYRWDGKTLVRFTTKDGLSSVSLGGFQEDDEGNVYVTGDGVCKFDGRSFTKLSVSTDSATTDWKLRPGDLWFPGPGNTGVVYRYDGEALHALAFPRTKDGDRDYQKYPRDQFPNAKYSPYDVYTIFQDSQGFLWFGTAILGVCHYDGSSFTWIPESELRNGSYGTRSIVEDKDGKFWFCKMQPYAVDRSDPAGPKFRKEERTREPGDGSDVPWIMSALVDDAGVLWMATYGNGVWRHDGKNFDHYPVQVGGQDITLFSISKDRQGVLWLGTQANGALRFNGKTFEPFRVPVK